MAESDKNGAMKVALNHSLDPVHDSVGAASHPHDMEYINLTGTVVVNENPSALAGVFLGEDASADHIIYDNTAGSGQIVAVLRSGLKAGFHPIPARCAIGLTVVSGAPNDITVMFREI